MSVKISVIKPVEKKKLTFEDLEAGAFFFLVCYTYTKSQLNLKTNIKNQFIEVESGTVNSVIKSDVEVILADVVIDVQIKRD